jgi:methylmalonyl-CoA/ethylmalonyl-CoA epimerase
MRRFITVVPEPCPCSSDSSLVGWINHSTVVLGGDFMIKRIDHVSIAVRDLDRAKRFFLDTLGGTEVFAETVEAEGFRWTAIVLGTSCTLELVDPVGDDSFLHRFLDSRGDAVHHITIQVNDARSAMDTLESRSVPTFGYSDSDSNWKYFYVHPKHAFGVLLQFSEFEPKAWVPKDSNYGLAATETNPVEVRRIEEDGTPAIELSDGTRSLRVAAEDVRELIEQLEQLEIS